MRGEMEEKTGKSFFLLVLSGFLDVRLLFVKLNVTSVGGFQVLIIPFIRSTDGEWGEGIIIYELFGGRILRAESGLSVLER
jgi:hypothetical protein